MHIRVEPGVCTQSRALGATQHNVASGTRLTAPPSFAHGRSFRTGYGFGRGRGGMNPYNMYQYYPPGYPPANYGESGEERPQSAATPYDCNENPLTSRLPRRMFFFFPPLPCSCREPQCLLGGRAAVLPLVP
jgi:hypothetical protein